MVPPGTYRDGALDSGDSACSTLMMDLSKMSSKRKSGGRRPKEDMSQLSPEEEEKRRLRRLRNKEAAARCRRRRVEHMCRLEGEVEDLLLEKDRLQEELMQLQREKMDLESALEAHLPYCSMPGSGDSSSEDNAPSADAKIGASKAYKGAEKTVTSGDQDVVKRSAPSRPKSLNILDLVKTPDLPSAMQTPSKIFMFDPLSMPTGMTPVTHKEVDPASLATHKDFLTHAKEEMDDEASPPCTPGTAKALVTL